MEQVSRAWGWALFFGILTLVLGILVVVWPSETLKILTILFGLQLFVMGIYSLVKSFSHTNEHKVFTVFLGIFSIIVGVIIIRNVTATIAVIGLIIGIYWIISGIVNFVQAVGDKTYRSRGFTIFMAIVSVIAGIIMVAWPAPTLTVIAWLVGIWFIVLGILGIVLAFMVRSEEKRELKAA
jgi:uncharacterized membrane protein HdeD (DUF308 family)